MSELIKFSVDNLEILEAANKSQFAKARVDFFASGNNSHNMPVKEESLRKYANTILGKPLVYIIEKGWLRKEDFGGHDPLEIPMGFFRESEEIEFRELGDGRVVASAVAMIWKKYADKAIKIFHRDGLQKPVSVELQVLKSEEDGNGNKELIDFCFMGCTVLGTDVEPAIKDAYIEILEFTADKSKYEKQLKLYESIDFTIPSTIVSEVDNFLKKSKNGNTSFLPTAISKAEYILNNKSVSPEKIQSFVNFFQKHKDDISFFLCGGEESKNWFNEISEKMKHIDKVGFSNTEIKKEDNMVDEEKVVVVEEEKEFTTDSNIEGVASLERSEEETEGDKELMSEEKVEEEEMQKDPEVKEEVKEEEMQKEEEEDNAFMQSLKTELFETKTKMTALEQEVVELRQFKANILEAERNQKIGFALTEVANVMNKDQIEDWKEKAKEERYSSIDVWANALKAEAFTYSQQYTKPESFTRMALPFEGVKTSNEKKSLWAD